MFKVHSIIASEILNDICKGNTQFLFLMNSKNNNHRHISPTGTDHYDSKLSKKLKFERKPFLNIPENANIVFWKVSFQPGTVLYDLRYNKSYDRCLVHSISNGTETYRNLVQNETKLLELESVHSKIKKWIVPDYLSKLCKVTYIR